MKSLKRTAAAIITILSVGAAATAFADFSDMPSGRMGVAINNAVNNGLLTGYDDGTVKPDEPITRAQMSAIIVRAFGTNANSQTSFADVSDSAWYKDAVEKAVYMGAFKGDENGNFNPENNITFQETYTVLARVFQFNSRNSSSGAVVMKAKDDCLDGFTDKDSVAGWALDYTKAVVDKGGYTGIDGLLKPTESISRGEFAIIMDELVSLYIDKPGTYTDGFGDATVVVRTGDVVIDGLNTTKNLILSYGVETKTEVKNSRVDGCIAIYGGTDKTPGADGKADESYISVSAHMYDVRALAPCSLISVDILNESANEVYLGGLGGAFAWTLK